MKIDAIQSAMRGVPEVVKEHSPAILVGTGLVCLVSAGVMAVRATPTAVRLMDDRAAEMYNDYADICKHNNEEPRIWADWLAVDDGKTITELPAYYPSVYFHRLGFKEVVKSTWKCYIPSAVTAGLGIACVIGGLRISGARTAAMAGIAGAAEKKLERYQEAVESVLDEDQVKSISDEVAKREIEEAYDDKSGVEIMECAMRGPDLVFESLTGRFFRSDRETIRSAINDFNHDLIGGLWADENEWFTYLGLPGVETGELLGWNSNRLLDIRIASMVAPNGEPALALVYNTLPSVTFK